MVDGMEFRRGLAASREYLLSHHPPAERDRCYAPKILGRRVHLCARCTGIYPGVVLGILLALVGPPALSTVAIVAVLPLAALGDWALTAFTGRRGSNVVRTATGFLLGYAYGLGLVALFVPGEFVVLAIGAGYAGLAAVALIVERARDPDGPTYL